MQCAACGSTLSAPDAACAVCDPWATPTRPAAQPAAVGLPRPRAVQAGLPQGTRIPQVAPGPATYLGSSFPRWYRLMIRRNPPVPTADLDAAWRATVIVSTTGAVTTLACAAASAAAAHIHTTGTAAAAGAVFFGSMAVAIVVNLVFRRKIWLGRVIALLGARPHIGYAALLRIPAISRLSTVYTLGQYTGCILGLGFVVDHRVSWMLIFTMFAVAFVLGAVQVALQANARESVARLLAG